MVARRLRTATSAATRLPTLSAILLLILLYTTSLHSPSSALQGDFQGPELCADCHQAQYKDWNSSKHAAAFSNRAFQSAWEDAGRAPTCLECHTTGFNSVSGTYAFEGVTCESCHGGPGAMVMDLSANACRQCHEGGHSPVYGEWTDSKHSQSVELLKTLGEDRNPACLSCHSTEGFVGNIKNEEWDPEKASTPIACSLCHTPHLTQLRFEPAAQLCGYCHEGPPPHPQKDIRTGTHTIMMDVTCEECHMYRKASGSGYGYASTGHTFRILEVNGEPVVCSTCHGVIAGLSSYDAAVKELHKIQAYYAEKNASARALVASADAYVMKANSTIQPYKKETVQNALALLESSQSLLRDARRIVDWYLPSDGSKGFHNPVLYSEKLSEASEKARHAESLAKAALALLPMDLQASERISQAKAEKEALQTQVASLGSWLVVAILVLASAAILVLVTSFTSRRAAERSSSKVETTLHERQPVFKSGVEA